jgi:hypothetical protein
MLVARLVDILGRGPLLEAIEVDGLDVGGRDVRLVRLTNPLLSETRSSFPTKNFFLSFSHLQHQA